MKIWKEIGIYKNGTMTSNQQDIPEVEIGFGKLRWILYKNESFPLYLWDITWDERFTIVETVSKFIVVWELAVWLSFSLRKFK